MKYEKRREINRIALSLALIICGIVLMTIAFYDIFDWRDFRVFAPILLFVCLGPLLHHQKMLIPAVLSVSISLIFLSHFGSINTFIQGRYTDNINQNAIARHIYYDKNASNRWDNTITTGEFDINLDAGIGVIYLLSDISENTQINSRYLLIGHRGHFEGYSLIDNDTVY